MQHDRNGASVWIMGIALATLAYVGLYAMTIRPGPTTASGVRAAWYDASGLPLSAQRQVETAFELLFAPLHSLDVRCRPDEWHDIEQRPATVQPAAGTAEIHE
jgi:hypothetical protein